MLRVVPLCDKVFRWLIEIDEETARRVAAAGCPWCGGRLHRGDYPRKPRGGLLAGLGEIYSRRISLCCATDGCRRRATPPSVRFLGRRVYLGVAVLLGSVAAQLAAAPRQARRTSGIPTRTVTRWRAWWQTDFVDSRLWRAEGARIAPPVAIAEQPASLLERFAAVIADADEALVRCMAFVAPLTTGSVVDGSRFVRVE